MRADMREVRYDVYCQTCKHLFEPEYEEPCNECLEEFINEGTDQPTKWEEKD